VTLPAVTTPDTLLERLRRVERPLPALLWRAARNRLWRTREKRVYVYDAADAARLPNPRILARDRREDLRYYERKASWQMSPDDYRAEARLRLARGEHLYTLVEGERLLHYAWLVPDHERGVDAALGQVFLAPPGSAALYDHYTHPHARGRGLYYQALCQLLHDVCAITPATRAYVYVYADNGPSRHVIEKVGFRHVGSLVLQRRLLLVRRFAVSAGGEFRTALL
jgi:RimJ/RimL family protein N-acetyltransferase